jgi:hypothetical protein
MKWARPTEQTAQTERRPGTITWGAGIMVVQGLLIYGLEVLTLAGAAITQGGVEYAFFDLLRATAEIVCGIGLYRRKRWAWVGAISVQAVGAAYGLLVLQSLGTGPPRLRDHPGFKSAVSQKLGDA